MPMKPCHASWCQAGLRLLGDFLKSLPNETLLKAVVWFERLPLGLAWRVGGGGWAGRKQRSRGGEENRAQRAGMPSRSSVVTVFRPLQSLI